MMVFFIIIFLLLLCLNRDILRISFCSEKYHIKGRNIFSKEFNSVYNIFNPSILKKNKKYICCMRCSTLSMKNLFNYLYGRYNYDSFLLFCEIENGKFQKIIFSRPCDNGYYEDPRMIEYNGNYLVSATEFIDKKNIFPVILEYDKNYNFLRRIDYNRENYFFEIPFQSIQKNWCPFEHKGMLYVHTDTFPDWKVFQVDNKGNMIKKVHKPFSPSLQNMFLRCSTSWKDYDNNFYICGLHTKTKTMIPKIRSMLVLIDKNTLEPVFYTDVFCLEKEDHDRIQYLSGIEVEDKSIILAYGIGDYKVVLKKVLKKNLNFNRKTF
jgi:predicted GH43/DUF377 family glycosyl hydrolase